MNEELRERLTEMLIDELVIHNITHEIPPPDSDCLEDCGVLGIHTGILAPVRSEGAKHRKCMDCWEGYITKLTTKIINLLEVINGVIDES